MTLFQPVAVPVWTGMETSETLFFSSDTFQSLTIPSAATCLLITSADRSNVTFYVTPVTNDPSGIRIGGLTSVPLVLRLGTSPVIRIKCTVDLGQPIRVIYFYGNPPGETCREPLDVPVWDNTILNREYTPNAETGHEIFLPMGSRWFSLSVNDEVALSDSMAYLSPVATPNTGMRFGGNSGAALIHRRSTKHLVSGTVTSADAGGDNLIDTTKDFIALGVTAGSFIHNRTDGSFARVSSVTATNLSHPALVHGGNTWEEGESYDVYDGPRLYIYNPEAVNSVAIGLLAFTK